MEFLSNKPLLITDTILRDAHQSQAATRMTLEQMLPACEILDSIGYYSLECWGGATFDVSNLYIAQVKQKRGIIERENYHKAKNENAKQPKCPKEKEDAIVEALKHFQMI